MDVHPTPLSLWTTSPHGSPSLHGLTQTVQAYIVREARTLWRKHVGDIFVLYTDTRWIGYETQTEVFFSNHDTDLCRAIWEAYHAMGEAYLASLYGQDRYPLEKDLVAAVVQVLTAEGWVCTCEMPTPYGRVDIHASKTVQIWLIEAKLTANAYTLARALGQLLANQAAYPTARLSLVTPETIPNHWLRLLEHHHIDIVEGPWTKPA